MEKSKGRDEEKMVGISTRRNPDGMTIHKIHEGVTVSIFLDAREACRVQNAVREARRKYWKPVDLRE